MDKDKDRQKYSGGTRHSQETIVKCTDSYLPKKSSVQGWAIDEFTFKPPRYEWEKRERDQVTRDMQNTKCGKPDWRQHAVFLRLSALHART